ncbi:calcium-binding protein 7 [Carlito syrichta]|uniref:Calcium-binding protein 7 n=2 Tax=Amniota TaxID=32524 RepID=A0A3Q0EHR4_CARSF|nr:calcium-binding protein 7 [Carlito syrichta]
MGVGEEDVRSAGGRGEAFASAWPRSPSVLPCKWHPPHGVVVSMLGEAVGAWCAQTPRGHCCGPDSPRSSVCRGDPDCSTLRALSGLPTVVLQALEIREAFKVFDRDGNGFISKQELGTAMRSLGYMPNEVELEVIIQRLDMDGDGQVDFEEFVTLLGPKLSTSGIPEKFHGTDFDTVFWKCDMQKLTVDELKRLLYDTFCEHLSMKDIENIIMTEEESHLGTAEECPVDVETCSSQQIRQTCVRKSLICAFAIAFIISVMLIAANQVLRSGMK